MLDAPRLNTVVVIFCPLLVVGTIDTNVAGAAIEPSPNVTVLTPAELLTEARQQTRRKPFGPMVPPEINNAGPVNAKTDPVNAPGPVETNAVGAAGINGAPPAKGLAPALTVGTYKLLKTVPTVVEVMTA